MNNGVMINGVIQSVFNGGQWGYLPPSASGNTFSYQQRLRSAQSLITRRSMSSCTDATNATFGFNSNDQLSGISNLASLDPQNTPMPAAYSPPTIVPMPIQYSSRAKDDSITIHWIPGSDETISNTTVVAVGGGQVIPSDSIRLGSALFKKGSIQKNVNYNFFLIINAGSNRIYQGSFTLLTGQSTYYLENLNYTSDGLFYSSYIDLGFGKQFVLAQNRYNTNGNLANFFVAGSAGQMEGAYESYNFGRYPTKVIITSANASDASQTITDTYTNTFLLFDELKIGAVHGTRTDQYGTSNSTSIRLYDPNSALTAISGINNPFNSADQNPNTLFLVNSLAGQILQQWSVSFTNGVSITAPTLFFPDARGHITAKYGMVSNPVNQTQMLLQLTADPVSALTASSVMNQPGSTVVQTGDNWTSISYQLFGCPDYAPIIEAYSGVTLTAGQVINRQQIIDAYNKARDYTPYQILIDVLYNSLNPALKTPQPPKVSHHESFWDEIIGAIVSVVVMIFVPRVSH